MGGLGGRRQRDAERHEPISGQAGRPQPPLLAARSSEQSWVCFQCLFCSDKEIANTWGINLRKMLKSVSEKDSDDQSPSSTSESLFQDCPVWL